MVGRPLGEFYINRYAGVNPANGDPLWYDKEGNLTTEFRESDKVMVGKNYLAPWQGGFGTTLTWKGISVNAQFSWVADRWMFNNDRFFEESNGLYTGFNQSKRLLYDRWKKPGDVTDIPRWGVTPQMDSRFLEDASFLRLKNLMISYTFPQEWMKKRIFSLTHVSMHKVRTCLHLPNSADLTRKHLLTCIRHNIPCRANTRSVWNSLSNIFN